MPIPVFMDLMTVLFATFDSSSRTFPMARSRRIPPCHSAMIAKPALS